MIVSGYRAIFYVSGGRFPTVSVLGLIFYLAASSALPAAELDSRQALNADSPQWLRAVGKLQVPANRYKNGRRIHHLEDCSATLVTNARRRRADTLVTAWHCLEFYGDLSKPIHFSLTSLSGEPLSRQAYRLADGGSMHRDWAILRLYEPIANTDIVAMRIHPEQVDPLLPITMAGYSRDDGIGRRGELLTYDMNCRITSHSPDGTDSDCTAYKGASGGAVVQLSDRGEALFTGVISQGDGGGVSIYIPVAWFRNVLNRYMQ